MGTPFTTSSMVNFVGRPVAGSVTTLTSTDTVPGGTAFRTLLQFRSKAAYAPTFRPLNMLTRLSSLGDPPAQSPARGPAWSSAMVSRALRGSLFDGVARLLTEPGEPAIRKRSAERHVQHRVGVANTHDAHVPCAWHQGRLAHGRVHDRGVARLEAGRARQ